MKTITVFGLAGASYALAQPLGAETFEHVRQMTPAKIYDSSSVLANNDYPLMDTSIFNAMRSVDNMMRSMFSPIQEIDVYHLPNGQVIQSQPHSPDGVGNSSPFSKFWGAQRPVQARPFGLFSSLFSEFDDLDLSPSTRYQRLGLSSPSKQTVEENEYDQPIVDRLTGRMGSQHVKTKDVKSEDGSVVIHSETRTFTGGNDSESDSEPAFTRDGQGEVLIESSPWQWMVEKSQADVDDIANAPEKSESKLSDVEAKKQELRDRLAQLRAEEDKISKMLQENELEENDADYDGQAEEDLEEEMEGLAESDQVLQEEIDELDEVEREIVEALEEEDEDYEEDEDEYEDGDEDEDEDEDEEEDEDYEYDEQEGDEDEGDDDGEHYLSPEAQAMKDEFYREKADYEHPDYMDNTESEQAAKEEFDHLVEDEYQDYEKQPLNDPDTPTEDSEGKDEEFGAEDVDKVEFIAEVPAETEKTEAAELDKDSHVRFEN